jgi:hypothetical protein
LFSERRFILHASVAHGGRAAALGEERSGGHAPGPVSVRKKKFSKKISSRVVKFIDRQEDFIILVSPARACRPSGHRVEGENSE